MRSAVLAVLPAVAAESYARAYPLVAKLHMLTEVEEAFGVMSRVGGGRGLGGRVFDRWGGGACVWCVCKHPTDQPIDQMHTGDRTPPLAPWSAATCCTGASGSP
jgi:hypothetical protein